MADEGGVPVLQGEVADLWVRCYQGEVGGELFFARMAAQALNTDERAKLEALMALERCTKELMAPCLERLGLSTEPDASSLGSEPPVSDYDYKGMLETIPALAAEFLGYYGRLRSLVDPQDAGVMDLVIAHELALELFMRRELAGELETSLQPIRALSHVTF
jgi:hypothetical protein